MELNTISQVRETPASGAPPSDATVLKEMKNTLVQNQEQAAKTKSNQPSLSVEEMKEIAETLNEYMDDLQQTNIGFSINEKLNHQVIVEIKDKKTNELVKQIPSEELIAIKEKMVELTGLLIDNIG